MVQFLGKPLEIPAALTNAQAVRKFYVDTADQLLADRITALESGGGAGGSGLDTTMASANYTAGVSDFVLADATGGPFTVTLPANPPANTIVAVKKVDNTTNLVTIVGTSPATIDGDPAVYLPSPQTAAQLVYDGTQWRVSSVVVYDTGIIPGFTYRGEYDPLTGYIIKDVVYYQGNSYVALTATTGNAPTVDASDARWGLIALHGLNGAKGDKGDKGDPGAPGMDGSGGGGGSFTQITTKTAAYTAVAGDFVLADGTSGGFSVTLPSNPPLGTVVAVKKHDITASTITVVGSNGDTIDGDTSALITTPQAGAAFLFDGDNWQIQATMVLESAQAFSYAGAYSNTATYLPADIVTYQGASYLSLTGSTGTAPTAGASSGAWGLIAKSGDTGPAGPTGAAGTQGTPGTAATITVGTTTTGVAGSSATVTNSGTNNAAVFDFSIPRGPAGIGFTFRGTWSTAATYDINDVVYLSGSSYVATSANSGSNPGTGGPWKLIVQKGDTGAQGVQGTTGATGATGPAGATGATGPQGPQGIQGNTGPAGSVPSVSTKSALPSGQSNGTKYITTDTGNLWTYYNGFWYPEPGTLCLAAYQTTPSDVPTAANTPIRLDAQRNANFSTYGNFSSGTNAYFMATAPGYYELSGGVSYAGNTTGYRAALFFKDNNPVPGSQNMSAVPSSSATAMAVSARNTVLYLTTSNTVQLIGYQNSNVTLATQTATVLVPTFSVVFRGWYPTS